MATVALTKENFEQTLTDNDIVLVDFWADWCGPCKMFAPIYEDASDKHPDVVFGKVDTEAEPELAGFFEIGAIPTLMAFRGQIGVFSQAGVMPGAALDDLIGQVKDLDMEAVREEIAEHEAKHGHEHGPDCDHDH